MRPVRHLDVYRCALPVVVAHPVTMRVLPLNLFLLSLLMLQVLELPLLHLYLLLIVVVYPRA